MHTPRTIPPAPASERLPGDTLTAALDVAIALYSGWRPGAADLAGAARLDDWTVVHIPELGTTALAGRVIPPGRDAQPGGDVTLTSPVVWLDREAGWARSVSRWYVLGTERRVFTGAIDNAFECGRRIVDIRRLLVAGGCVTVQ